MRTIRGLLIALVAVVGTVVLTVASAATTLIQLTATTALIMGGTGMKTPSQSFSNAVNDAYLHLPDPDFKWVQTPEHFWPATGPNDMTFGESVALGVLSLDNDIRTTPGKKVVVGYSQSGTIATREKRHLDYLRSQGATGLPSPDDLSFLLLANPNRPNGGILARFPGLYVPILDVMFDGATPDDEYKTIDVAREYDLIADFPEYPLNLLADINAFMGYFQLHPYYGPDQVNLDDPSTYESYTQGNTTYYRVRTQNLPILQPLRDLGVHPALIHLIEPVLRTLIELGYDRTPENMGVPTSAKLFRHIDLKKLAADLDAAIQKGVNDALNDLGIKRPQEPEKPAPAEPKTSEPKTSELKTSEPKTSELKTTEPKAAKEPKPVADPSTTTADAPSVKGETTPKPETPLLQPVPVHVLPGTDAELEATATATAVSVTAPSASAAPKDEPSTTAPVRTDAGTAGENVDAAPAKPASAKPDGAEDAKKDDSAKPDATTKPRIAKSDSATKPDGAKPGSTVKDDRTGEKGRPATSTKTDGTTKSDVTAKPAKTVKRDQTGQKDHSATGTRSGGASEPGSSVGQDKSTKSDGPSQKSGGTNTSKPDKTRHEAA
ncbi:PE-PPE domain-containing protein [Mycobacterium sp. NPDC004974]